MDAFPKLPEITETELANLVTQAEDLQKRVPCNLRNDVLGAVKLIFRQLSRGVLTYSARPADGIPLLDNAAVEVSNKRSGGNPKVRVSSAVVNTSYVALITVTDSDGTAHYIRLVRCACCVEENDGWFPISRQKSIVTVAALPLSLCDIKDELHRRHERLVETKRRMPTVVEAPQTLHRRNVQPETPASLRRVNKRRVPSEVIGSECGRGSSLSRCATYLLHIFALLGILMSPLKVYQLTAAKDPSGFGTVAFTDGVHMGHYSRFLQFFKSLEDNETRVKSWLENVRRPNTKISACIESGEVYDYVDQLKAVMEDMSMMLHKMSRWIEMDGCDDDIRDLLERLGLLEPKFSYNSLVYANAGDDAGEFKEVAEFAYLFLGHVEVFLARLPLPDHKPWDEVLLLDAMAIRYWVGQRWVRLGQTERPPLHASTELDGSEDALIHCLKEGNGMPNGVGSLVQARHEANAQDLQEIMHGLDLEEPEDPEDDAADNASDVSVVSGGEENADESVDEA